MDSLSGPVGVVNVIGDAYKESKSEGTLMTWLTMINMMILISANLGVAICSASGTGWWPTGSFY